MIGRSGPAQAPGRARQPVFLGTVRIPPRRQATTILTLVISGYGFFAIIGVVFATASVAQGVLSTLFVLALIALQLGYLSRPDLRPRAPWSYLALAAQAALVFLPIQLFGPLWHGFPGFLAGSALIVLRPAAGVPVFVLVVAALLAVSLGQSPITEGLGGAVSVTYLITSAITSGLALYGLSTLVRLVVEAHDARAELGRAAVARERMSFARDVHELLGQSLSAIALRGELVARLVGEHTDRARAELADLLVLSRRALADVRTVAGIRGEVEPEGPPAPGAVRTATDLAPRLGWVLLGVVLVDFSTIAVLGVFLGRGAATGVAAMLVALAMLGLILGWVVRPRAGARPPSRWALAGVVALAYLPTGLFGPYWHGLPGFVGGVALLVLPTVPGGVALLLTALSAVVLEYLDPAPTTSPPYSLVYTGVGVVIVSLIIYGLGAVARLVVEVHEARHELSRIAVAQERTRFSRDVHDLLGLGLSTITLKCELTGKLLEPRPEQAREELSDLLLTARRALADVRSVIGGGNRELSLVDECRLVQATLVAAEVEVRMQRLDRAPPGPVGTVLATVLREGATNVLRHSHARWCEISLREVAGAVTLEIVNDGIVARAGPPDPESGNGLRNLSFRVESLGGDLSAAVDGRVYRLRARVPVSG